MSEVEKARTCTGHISPEADEVANAYKMADSATRFGIRRLLGLDVQSVNRSSISLDTEDSPNMGGIDYNKICKDHCIRVCSYQSLRKIEDWPKNCEHLDSIMRETSGIAFSVGGKQPVIAFDADRPALEKRYIVAHELGHILLGHLSFRANTKEKMPDFSESEANIFAAVLTANDILCRYGREATV